MEDIHEYPDFTKIHKLRGKKKAFLLAFVETFPRMNITEAANKLGIARENYYQWRLKDSKFAKAVDKAIEEFNDMTEGFLREFIKQGPPDMRLKAIMYYLDRKCRDRGYGQKQELTGPGGGPLEIQVIDRFVLPKEGTPPEGEDHG